MQAENEPENLKALRRLEKRLSEGRSEFTTDARGGAITSLQATIEFFRSINDFRGKPLTLPLTAVLEALHSLEHGAVAPIVRPKKTKGRPRQNSWPDTVKAASIFCVDVLHERGKPLPAALTVVSRELTALKFAMSGKRGSTAATTLRGWREGLSQREEPDQLLNAYKEFGPLRENYRKMPADEAWRQ